MKRLSALIVAGCLLAITACSSSSTTSTPPVPFHIYTDDFLNPGTINIFTSPLSAASVPSGTFAGNNEPASMTLDSTHRLFVTNFGSDTVQVFNAPIATGAIPAFTLSTPALQAEDAAFDPSGNLFVTGLGNIAEFASPITGASTVNFSITNVDTARGIVFDSSGNLWSNGGAHINEYTTPLSGASTPALQFAGTGNSHGIAFSAAGSIFAAGHNGVDVYNPPFSVASTPAFTIPIAPAFAVSYLKFDASGNLYATANGSVLVFVPPFSGASTAAVTVPLPGGPGIPGIAIGP